MDPNSRNSGNWTAIMYASLFSHNETVLYLLEMKADVNMKNPSGKTPLMLASLCGSEETIKLLLTVKNTFMPSSATLTYNTRLLSLSHSMVLYWRSGTATSLLPSCSLFKRLIANRPSFYSSTAPIPTSGKTTINITLAPSC